MSEIIERNIETDSMEMIMELFGAFDKNIKLLEEETGVTIVARGTRIDIVGEKEKTALVSDIIDRLMEIIKKGERIDTGRIRYVVELAMEGRQDLVGKILSDVVCTAWDGKQIRCKTYGQKKYVDAIRKYDIVFGIGPAGTGKTYLAMAMAVNAYKQKQVAKIILTRPAVEAGEKLGFLPGDLQTKIDPYLRPLYDALFDLMGAETYLKLLEKGVIEVAPLAYMRGRTLDNAFIILDEAQNTTSEQMKMFLTRTGLGSKVIVNGDVTQIDLPAGKKSGLREADQLLNGIKGIGFSYFTFRDVVRHQLVKRIIEAYNKQSKDRNYRDEKSDKA